MFLRKPKYVVCLILKQIKQTHNKQTTLTKHYKLYEFQKKQYNQSIVNVCKCDFVSKTKTKADIFKKKNEKETLTMPNVKHLNYRIPFCV